MNFSSRQLSSKGSGSSTLRPAEPDFFAEETLVASQIDTMSSMNKGKSGKPKTAAERRSQAIDEEIRVRGAFRMVALGALTAPSRWTML